MLEPTIYFNIVFVFFRMKKEHNELIHRLALHFVPGIGSVKYKKLLETFGNATDVFKQNTKSLKKTESISDTNVQAIKNFTDFDKIETLLDIHHKKGIEVVFFDEEKYPQKLIHCVDCPPFLFYKGNTNFNADKIISIVGTRNCTEYGKKICEELVSDLKAYDVTIVSGLAMGIDIAAHKTCVKNGLPTIAILAHGLGSIYPLAHKSVADSIMENGAIMSEYVYDVKAETGFFPMRNRIVAGISDATIVIETQKKGGSMITAELALGYNKDVFAVPGRIKDSKSEGCNYLIQSQKAQLISSAADIANQLCWNKNFVAKPKQLQLFIELSEDEKNIYTLLQSKEKIHIDELVYLSNLNSSKVAGVLLNLEMQGIIKSMPGKMITLA